MHHKTPLAASLAIALGSSASTCLAVTDLSFNLWMACSNMDPMPNEQMPAYEEYSIGAFSYDTGSTTELMFAEFDQAAAA